MPLAESPPFRLRLAHHPDGDVLLMNANHAAFDGFGCVRLLQSGARIYTGQADPLPDVDLSDARDVERHLGTDDERVKVERLAAIAEKLRDVLRAPARIAPDGGDDESAYRIVHRSLSAEGTDQLADADVPGSVNDVLMAALHLAVDAWKSSGGRNGCLCGPSSRSRRSSGSPAIAWSAPSCWPTWARGRTRRHSGPGAGEPSGMWFSAPARLPCGLSLGTLTADGRLHLSFRWRRPLVGQAAAERFADVYLERVAELVGADVASLGA